MTDITSLTHKLNELQVKYNKQVKLYDDLYQSHKEQTELLKDYIDRYDVITGYNLILQDKYEELYQLQLKYDKLKEAFEELLEKDLQFVSDELGWDTDDTSTERFNWNNKAGLL